MLTPASTSPTVCAGRMSSLRSNTAPAWAGGLVYTPSTSDTNTARRGLESSTKGPQRCVSITSLNDAWTAIYVPQTCVNSAHQHITSQHRDALTLVYDNVPMHNLANPAVSMCNRLGATRCDVRAHILGTAALKYARQAHTQPGTPEHSGVSRITCRCARGNHTHTATHTFRPLVVQLPHGDTPTAGTPALHSAATCADHFSIPVGLRGTHRSASAHPSQRTNFRLSAHTLARVNAIPSAASAWLVPVEILYCLACTRTHVDVGLHGQWVHIPGATYLKVPERASTVDHNYAS